MAPKWDDEEEGVTSAPHSPPPVAPLRRGAKFDDEESGDSDVADAWDEDSEDEEEKAKKTAKDEAKKAAEAAKPKISKAQRIAQLKAQRAAELAGDDFEDYEDEAERRARLRRSEKEADLSHAEDLFGSIGVNPNRKGATIGTAVVTDANNPASTVDMTKMPLFNPMTKTQFETLRNTLAPLLSQSSKKPHYNLFLQEFTKQLARDLASDQIKKIASTLTALSNEKMREEKAAEKGGKKSKAAKTKTSLNASRPGVTDTNTYEDEFGDDDFM
ncbi:Eukaryotic translation initiation factor 3 subunit J [Ceratocystis fimbriata CBS 114723]|uniref:Eukaryotic translation initiation factor 3 subunit J n=1 Tax=Ceratocystis fimbriata CBS 114723 TaxID=1035309 RepID=A0A2C5X8I7_9PEZI|nr:Eukaryotic translation initiation factor 3 subunit J [Ceratocystis fimbriata CBS 114723]